MTVKTSPFAPRSIVRASGGAKSTISVKNAPPAMSTAAMGQVTKVRRRSMLGGA